MKKTHFLLVLLIPIVLVACRSEIQDETEQNKEGFIIKEKPNGALVVLGSKQFHDYDQLYVMTISESGDFLAGYRFGAIGNELPNNLHENYNGDYGVLTTTFSKDHQSSDIRYINCTTDGEPSDHSNITADFVSSKKHFYAQDFVRNNNNTYTICGYAGPEGEAITFVARIHENGTVYWRDTYGVSAINKAFSICTTEEGENVLGGCLSDQYPYLRKIDRLGNELWGCTFPAYEMACFVGVETTHDQGILAGGNYLDGRYSSFLVRTTASGDSLWSKNLDGRLLANNSFHILSDGSLIIGLNKANGYALVKTDQFGNELWTSEIQSSEGIHVNAIQPTLDNGFVLTGRINNSKGVSYIYVSRFNQNGEQIWKTGL